VGAQVSTGAQVGVFQVAIVWGLGIAIAIHVTGALSDAHLNPARDLGPRVLSSLVGWGEVPFRVNGLGWITVHIVAPLWGGLAGADLYRCFFRRACQRV
jgi:glycerol uptake facilitator protein